VGVFKAIKLIVVLFVATCLFCWMFTAHWIFGPITTIVSFVGGVLLISLLGMLILEQ